MVSLLFLADLNVACKQHQAYPRMWTDHYAKQQRTNERKRRSPRLVQIHQNLQWEKNILRTNLGWQNLDWGEKFLHPPWPQERERERERGQRMHSGFLLGCIFVFLVVEVFVWKQEIILRTRDQIPERDQPRDTCNSRSSPYRQFMISWSFGLFWWEQLPHLHRWIIEFRSDRRRERSNSFWGNWNVVSPNHMFLLFCVRGRLVTPIYTKPPFIKILLEVSNRNSLTHR